MMPHQDEGPQTKNSAEVTPDNNGVEKGGSATCLNRANNGVLPNSDDPVVPAESNEKVVKTSSGRVSRPPKRFGQKS